MLIRKSWATKHAFRDPAEETEAPMKIMVEVGAARRGVEPCFSLHGMKSGPIFCGVETSG